MFRYLQNVVYRVIYKGIRRHSNCSEAQKNIGRLRRVQRGLKAQKNAGIFEGSEKCRKVSELRRIQEGLMTHMRAGRFENSEK